ncbi:autotransporter outer membrane beta-barrel domain-containing protein [Helicobacter cappadocius]|uniref:Autotransporter outer membrane beta-barrel domain-containing protein n=1 Tax=Helicobacter cappadocius TaxID=3063998 RepID=A0AA90TE87_9HELI|nr:MULTISPECIES: autotransporter outer membrane beta-barrel domain-containing protein [unclassified Helicobacter]MDO7252473.1 autotransporter outer membrane beta-barrel domain-containing protein [Helicobacter sp. faydin-H75]MDP2538340.1 autotransporter outer membrane beta-barrel domain-containing protein [Helicobacter sp. faydin-H76]
MLSFLNLFQSKLIASLTSRPFFLSLTLAGSLFPFTAYADTIDSGACTAENSNCNRFYFLTNSDANFQNHAQVYTLTTYNGTTYGGYVKHVSTLQNFNGTISDMIFQGINLIAPRLNISANTNNIKTITDSQISSDLFGSFYKLVVKDSDINGFITAYGDGKWKNDNLTFDHSNITGSIINASNNPGNQVHLTFSNGSVLKGDIIINSTATYDATKSPNFSAIMWTEFDNSTWYGNFKDISADAHFESHLTLRNTQVNPDSDTKTNFNFVNGMHYFNVEDSNLNADISIQAHTFVNLKNSSVHNINQMGGGHDGILNKDNTLTLDHSSADYIGINGGITNITMTNNSIIGSKDPVDHNVIFVSGGWGSLTMTDSTINGAIDLDAYNSLPIKATNSTFNVKSGKKGWAILNYFGTINDSYLDHSTMNGGILWINSTFTGGNNNEGFEFRNGSVLNGDLHYADSPYGVSSTGANFAFKDSTMNGNITSSTSNVTQGNPITRVMFRQSTLNGDISISSKNLNSTDPKNPSKYAVVDMSLGFWQSTFNFNNITSLSDDTTYKPKLAIALNETNMIGEDIKNQGDLTIVAGDNSLIRGNITTGIADDGTPMKNATLDLHLTYWDYTITNGIAQKNTSGVYKTSGNDDMSHISTYEGRLITGAAGNNIHLDSGTLSLLPGSNVTAFVKADITSNQKNTIKMQDSFFYMTNKSIFTGALISSGYNRLTLDSGVSINLNSPSAFRGSLVTLTGGGAININATSALFLKPNENSNNLYHFSSPSANLGFEGTFRDSATGGNYLELDSSQKVPNGLGNYDDAVVLVLDKGTAATPNTFKGTLFAKGSKNYLYLGDYSQFTLDTGSFFDGVLVTKQDDTANHSVFNNANGNVVLEDGSYFRGSLSANTLTLKGANIINNNDTTIKAIQVLSGNNSLNLSASTTAPILNTGGGLDVDFNPTDGKPISFKGGIYTYGDAGTHVSFTKTLYADPDGSTIIATGRAVSLVEYISDMATIQTFASTLEQIPDRLPVYNIYTKDSAVNGFFITGPFSAKANIHYSGGRTLLILADSMDTTTDSAPTDTDTPADASDIDPSQIPYKDGVLIYLDASKANTLLSDYRNLYPENFASLSVDKLSSITQAAQMAACKADSSKCLKDDDPSKINGFVGSDGTLIYKAYLDGILVGNIASLSTSTSTSKKQYIATLNPNSAFVGSMEIKDTPISVNLSEGSKLVFTKDSTIQTLTSSSDDYIDRSSLTAATLAQNNTIIDLATNADPHNLVKKDNYSTLNIDNLNGVSDVVFKFSFGKDSSGNNASDRLVVTNTTNSKNNIMQIYQNLSHPTELQDGEKLLIASIANGGSIDGGKIFETGQIFNNEGFDTIKSSIVVLDQNSNDPTTATSGATYSNYYLTSISSSINTQAANISKAALNSNRSILLGNINDLNKRLGELRNNPYTQGAWARIFNGMTSSDYGIAVRNIFTNVQAGYDYSVGDLRDANQYVGVAISYGYSNLNASSVDLKGNANMIELGAYYSYVADSGLYTDSILKYAFINNKLSIDTTSAINYNTNALTFGQEVGYRFFLDRNKKFYIDPLAEITLGYFGGGNVDRIKGDAFLNTKFDPSFLYRVKIGGNMGYRLITSRNETDFRAGLSYVLDGNIGDISMNSNLSSATHSIPVSNTGLLQLGANSIISSNWRAYVDLDVGFGSSIFRQDYLISLGGRYIFGKKSRVITPVNNPLHNNKPSNKK